MALSSRASLSRIQVVTPFLFYVNGYKFSPQLSLRLPMTVYRSPMSVSSFSLQSHLFFSDTAFGSGFFSVQVSGSWSKFYFRRWFVVRGSWFVVNRRSAFVVQDLFPSSRSAFVVQDFFLSSPWFVVSRRSAFVVQDFFPSSPWFVVRG